MEPGVYNLSSEEYHLDPTPEPSLSRSAIKDLLFRSPAHAWFNHPKLNPNYQIKEEAKFDLGTAAHSLLLEASDNIVVIEADDWRTKAAKEERDKARGDGRTPLLRHQYDSAKEMVDVALQSIYACKELKITDLRADGDAELSYIWKEKALDSDHEIWLKVRPDWISKDRKLILDYKTTRQSANPDEIDRTVTNMQMDIQEAFYRRGVKAINETDPKFIFMFQEVEPPYLCSFIGLLPQFQETGKSKCDYGIFIWGECLRTGKWAAYPNRVCWIEPKPWALAAWESRAENLGEEGE